MSPQPAQPHTWAVSHQEEEATIDDNGRPTTMHHIHFITNVGHKSTVVIPDEQFTAANVAKAVAAKASELLKVHNLNSSNAPQNAE